MSTSSTEGFSDPGDFVASWQSDNPSGQQVSVQTDAEGNITEGSDPYGDDD